MILFIDSLLIIIGMFLVGAFGYKQGLETPKEYKDWPRWLVATEYQSKYYYYNLIAIAVVVLVHNLLLYWG